MSEPTLTLKEISEIIAFAREHPELASMIRTMLTPRQALEMVRERKALDGQQ